jgi:hypothetical protein
VKVIADFIQQLLDSVDREVLQLMELLFDFI